MLVYCCVCRKEFERLNLEDLKQQWDSQKGRSSSRICKSRYETLR